MVGTSIDRRQGDEEVMSYTLDQLIENGGGYVHQDILEQARAEVDAELAAYKLDHCQCPSCCGGVIHKSDCSVHNMPHEPNGNCDCMAEDYEALWESYVASRARIAELTAEVSHLRDALLLIANGYVIETSSVQNIARTALREGK